MLIDQEFWAKACKSYGAFITHVTAIVNVKTWLPLPNEENHMTIFQNRSHLTSLE